MLDAVEERISEDSSEENSDRSMKRQKDEKYRKEHVRDYLQR